MHQLQKKTEFSKTQKERKKMGERERERKGGREKGRNERDREKERVKKGHPREREGSGAHCIDERGIRRGMLGGVRTGRFLPLR